MAHGSALIPSPNAVEKSGETLAWSRLELYRTRWKNMQPGTELTLVRNDDYYEGIPVYEKITFRYVGDASARVSD